jgi:glycosyltransferase involved in cell wall biosynthesis
MIKKEDFNYYIPLVSVVLVTYNSEPYVLETLESIKSQSYLNIELIISDDCSSDNTINICKKWLDQNEERFIRVEIVRHIDNTGITPNYNRGTLYARGEWIKYIAGDDILVANCIQRYVDNVFVLKNKIFVSCVIQFDQDFNERLIEINKKWLKGDSKKQLIRLLKYGTFLPGPTIFVHRETLNKLGCFSEEYPFVEDYPLFVKFLLNGYPLGFINEGLVKWRKHEDSVSHNDERFADSIYRYIENEVCPLYVKYFLFFHWWDYNIMKLIRKNNNNIAVSYFLAIIDPLYVIRKIKKSNIPVLELCRCLISYISPKNL